MTRILAHALTQRELRLRDSYARLGFAFDGQREMEMSPCLPQCAAGTEQASLAVAFISLK